jgi:hypothetical protein
MIGESCGLNSGQKNPPSSEGGLSLVPNFAAFSVPTSVRRRSKGRANAPGGRELQSE